MIIHHLNHPGDGKRITQQQPALLCAVLSHWVVWLFATPWTVACQTPLSMGILQARILEWVAMPFSKGSSRPRYRTRVSCIADSLPAKPPGKPCSAVDASNSDTHFLPIGELTLLPPSLNFHSVVLAPFAEVPHNKSNCFHVLYVIQFS